MRGYEVARAVGGARPAEELLEMSTRRPCPCKRGLRCPHLPRTLVGVPSEYGPLLRVARTRAGISLRALSMQAGINHNHLGRFERGMVPVSHHAYSRAVLAVADLIAHVDDA